MSLSDGDKAECKEIAREIVKEVLLEHIISCPHGLALARSKALIIGAFVGGAFGGGGITIGIAKMLSMI